MTDTTKALAKCILDELRNAAGQKLNIDIVGERHQLASALVSVIDEQFIRSLVAENEQKFSSVVHECCVDVQALKAQLSEVKAAGDDMLQWASYDGIDADTEKRWREVTKGIDA